MPKNRQDLKERLLHALVISGLGMERLELPGRFLGFPDHIVIAFAIEALRKNSKLRLTRVGLDMLGVATQAAENDVRVLGHAVTSAVIRGYLGEFRKWTSPGDVEFNLKADVKKLEHTASAHAKRHLRESLKSKTGLRRNVGQSLSLDSARAVGAAIQAIVRARLLHERALRLRPEFISLATQRQLPAKGHFLKVLDRKIRHLVRQRHATSRGAIETIIGESAATSSRWRLAALRWEMERCDLELRPLGSYLIPRRSADPKVLRIWAEIDYRLRRQLLAERNDYAISRILSAALKVYGGNHFAPASDPDLYARDAVEKLRRRISSEWIREIEEQIGTEESRITVNDGLTGTTGVSIEPARRRATTRRRRTR